jgi:hypothetical protein
MNMKKAPMILCSAILAVSLISGCQPTPESDIVVQKDLEQMIDMAQATPETSAGSLAERLGAPAHIVMDELTSAPGTFIALTDADVIVPDVAGMATVRVGRHAFTQEDAARIAGVLFEGQATYSGEVLLSKQYYRNMILEFQRQLAAETDEEKRQQLEGSIAKFQGVMDSLPEGEGLVAAAPEFTEQNGVQRMYLASDGTDGGYRTFSVSNNAQVVQYEMLYLYGQRGYVEQLPNFYNERIDTELRYGREAGGSPETIPGLSVTAEQAQAQADALVPALGMGGFACNESAVVFGQWEGQWIKAYSLEYTRAIEGAPVTYVRSDASGAEDDGKGGYIEGWAYERLSFIIGDAGVLAVSLTNPYDITETLAENTSLLPFDAVMDTYSRMILVTNSFTDMNVVLRIDRVALGLARVTDSATRETGIVVPAWDFFGTMTVSAADGGDASVLNDPAETRLTINAVDGTVIDRNLGY